MMVLFEICRLHWIMAKLLALSRLMIELLCAKKLEIHLWSRLLSWIELPQSQFWNSVFLQYIKLANQRSSPLKKLLFFSRRLCLCRMRADLQNHHTTKLFWMLYRNLISRLTPEMSVHILALNVITVAICGILLHPQMVNKWYGKEKTCTGRCKTCAQIFASLFVPEV